MANLLTTPSSWMDFDGDSPPSYWNGMQYVLTPGGVLTQVIMSHLATPDPGSTVAGSVSGSGFGTGFYLIIASNGVVLQAIPMDGATYEFSHEVISSTSLFIADDPLALEPTDVDSGSATVMSSSSAVSYNCECEDDDPTRPMQTLAEMRKRMLTRCGFANNADNPPAGTAALFDLILQDAQRFLFDQYAHFRTARFFRWPLVEGVRFYDLDANDDSCPKKLSAEHLIWVGISRLGDPDTLQGEQWEKLICGINPLQYSGGPLMSWPTHFEIRQCIEVYPAPGPDAGYLRIKGHFGLARFTEDTDKTTLDPDLIFYHAAADYFSTGPRPDPNKARTFGGLERARLGDLIASSHQTRRYFPGDPNIPTPAPPVLKGPYVPPGP